MTTFTSTGTGGSGDDELPKQPPEGEKDKEVVKEEMLATTKEALKAKVQTPSGRDGKFRVRPGGFLGASLRQGGVTLQKPTEESRRQRAEEAQKAEEVRQAAKKSIEDEFWGAYEKLGVFGYSKRGPYRHMEDGEDPDEVTFKFFADMPADQWLTTQPRSAFVLVRTTSKTHGDGIGFTVYFREDLKDKRRSVAGYLQGGELTIVHVGPVT